MKSYAQRIYFVLAWVGPALYFFTLIAGAASFTSTGPLAVARKNHTATLLQNGKVLVTGGVGNGFNSLASAELYDPATGTWTNTGAMSLGRQDHTATLLPNGKVLVAGGGYDVNVNSFSSAELYDPATGTWTNTGPMTIRRATHTATLLSNGKVLVTGGSTGNIFLYNAEVYDPATETWTAVTNLMTDPRFLHTATLLPSGQVYVAGGAGGVIKSSADLYDQATGSFSPTGPLQSARCYHTSTLLPNGLVLIAGGGVPGNTQPADSTAELFDPVSGTSSYTNSMNVGRQWHTATLLPNGQVLVIGGHDATTALRSVEFFDSISGTWTITNNALAAAAPRCLHTATLMANGKVLIAGGSNGTNALSSAVVYDYASGSWTTNATTSLHFYHVAVLLPTGNVLVTGGSPANAELYRPASGTWAGTGVPSLAYYQYTATLLPNGKVLIAGGLGANGVTNSAELYDPSSETWTITAPMNTPRRFGSATLLLNGKVLMTGGYNDNVSSSVASSEIFEPTPGPPGGAWTPTGSMTTPRDQNSATRLLDGRVLVAGGIGGGLLASAEIYDPATGRWTPTGSMSQARYRFVAVLLPNGKVLVVGGSVNTSTYLSSCELYNPITGTWTNTGSMSIAREWATATLLPDGRVLVAGGDQGVGNYVSTVEIYDPATGKWKTDGPLIRARSGHAAALLPNGKVLLAGGNGLGAGGSAEFYNPGFAFDLAWQPQVSTINSPLNLGASLTLTGTRFRGVAGGSSGNSQDSPGDYPLVQLRSIEGGQSRFLLASNWSVNSFTTQPVWNFPPGWALATVFVNGIQSTSSIVNVSVPVPTPPLLTDTRKLGDGSLRFNFANSVGAVFGVLATTNLSLPASTWTALGGVIEISPGQFQFTDSQATNNPQRFYRARAP